MLEQIRIDATQQIATLAENRLGISGPITSVRQAARTTGLTRARVYQLLNEINDIMMVRWPTGRHQSHELREQFQAEAAELDAVPDLRQFYAAVELSIPAAAAARPDRWNRPSIWPSKTASCSKCRDATIAIADECSRHAGRSLPLRGCGGNGKMRRGNDRRLLDGHGVRPAWSAVWRTCLNRSAEPGRPTGGAAKDAKDR